MGTSIVRTLDSNQMQQLDQQRQALLQVNGSGAATGKFNFFAAFDDADNPTGQARLKESVRE